MEDIPGSKPKKLIKRKNLSNPTLYLIDLIQSF